MIASSRALSTARSTRAGTDHPIGLHRLSKRSPDALCYGPLDRSRQDLVQRERFSRVDRLPVTGGLDEVADQARELLDPPDGRAEYALAPFDGQVRSREQLDVRTVRGQRRPKLV